MAIANRNYMDIGGPGKKTDKPKPLYTIPAKNSSVGSAAAGAGVGAIKDVASKMQGKKDSYTPPADTGGYTETASQTGGRDADYYANMIEDALAEQKRALREQQRAEERKLQAAIDQGVNTLEAQRPDLQKQFDDAAQQLYIQNMQAKRDLPQQMAAQGLGGGLHESSLVGLDSSYGNNLTALQGGYDSSLAALDRDIANLKATGEISIAENANTYAQKLAEAAAEAQAAQLAAQVKAAGMNSGGGDPSLTYAQALEAYNNGNRSPGVLNLLRSYYQDPNWGADETTQQKANNRVYSAPTQLSNSALAYMRNRGLMLGSEEETNAADLLNQVAQGRLTPQDAQAIARYYGFSLNF